MEQKVKKAWRSTVAALRSLIAWAAHRVRKWRVEYLRGKAYEGQRINEYVDASIRYWRRYEQQ